MQLNMMTVMMTMKITLTSHTNAFFSACARYFDAVEYDDSDDAYDDNGDDEDHSDITHQCILLSLC